MKDPLSRSAAALCPVDDPPPIPDHINSVLESRCFQSAPALRTLLLFLWHHRNDQISEYAIATEALGRSSLFDPKTDATVRVQISRLRQRLEKFYENEGRGHRERLIVPLGSHQISLESATQIEEIAAATPQLITRPSHSPHRYLIGLLATACCIFLAVSTILGLQLHRKNATPSPASPQIAPQFWKSFYGNGLATRIILPTPVFFSYAFDRQNAGRTMMIRDTDLNDFSTKDKSNSLRLVDKLLGQPTLAQNYTVTSDTFAAIKLVRYLDGYQFSTTVHSSADAVLESLDSANLIAIGTWGTLSPFASYLDKMDFKLAPHEDSVENRNPSAGEPKFVPRVAESADRAIWPGIIAILPGQNGRSHLLVIGGRQTSGLVSFLTCTNGLSQFNQLWRAKGSPEFYEMIVDVEMNGDYGTPVRFWPVVLRPIKNHS